MAYNLEHGEYQLTVSHSVVRATSGISGQEANLLILSMSRDVHINGGTSKSHANFDGATVLVPSLSNLSALLYRELDLPNIILKV
jgi:hypothetical protein